ncbi:hypothetical protein HOD61_01460 [archaeon]|jgi:hypothetical protein|nr:hypothetical protein [archaeon]
MKEIELNDYKYIDSLLEGIAIGTNENELVSYEEKFFRSIINLVKEDYNVQPLMETYHMIDKFKKNKR